MRQAASAYKHLQTAPATTWTIPHNLCQGTNLQGIPVVDVIVDDGLGGLTKIMPSSVTIIDANTVSLEFTSARSGYAVVII